LRTNRNAPYKGTIRFNEHFTAPKDYPDFQKLPYAPDVSQFPNGVFTLEVNNFSHIIGFFPESQLEKMLEIDRQLRGDSPNQEPETDGSGNDAMPVLPADEAGSHPDGAEEFAARANGNLPEHPARADFRLPDIEPIKDGDAIVGEDAPGKFIAEAWERSGIREPLLTGDPVFDGGPEMHQVTVSILEEQNAQNDNDN